MSRKLLAIALCVLYVFSLGVVADATNISTQKDDIVSSCIKTIVEQKIDYLGEKMTVQCVELINDFNGNKYAVVECDPIGYFIYHVKSGICVEYNLNGLSPFLGISGEGLYGGPTYYYEKCNQKYTHTILNTSLEKGDIEAITAKCADMNQELANYADKAVVDYIQGISKDLPSTPQSKGIDYWVSSKDFFSSATSNFGYVSGGYCGYIAASLILRYWDYRGVITLNSFYTDTPTNLTDALIIFGEDSYGSSTWAANISSLINDFCEFYGLPEEATWAIGSSGITSEIDNKRPVILFGDLNYYNAGNHAVVVYGYNTYENANYITYRCHFGWNSKTVNGVTSNYSDVHIFGGNGSIFGSNTKYNP